MQVASFSEMTGNYLLVDVSTICWYC